MQGVCYRVYARQEAMRLGVTGWVRNLSDGNVEVVAEGEEGPLADFIEWCRRGPSYASVAGVDEAFSQATGEFSGFEITR